MTARPWYGPAWQRLAARVLAQHRAENGDWCPGWRTPAHPATDLTVDHVDPRSLARGVAVLCRSCNGRKGASRPPAQRSDIWEGLDQ